jgi:hypothetical protein
MNWKKIKEWRGWLKILLVLSVVASIFIAIYKFLFRKEVIRETKRVPVPKPEKDFQDEYDQDKKDNLRDSRDLPRDPDELSRDLADYRRRRR